MPLRLNGHHRRLVGLRLYAVINGRPRIELLKRVRVVRQVLLGLAVVLALALLAVTPHMGKLPRLDV